jgi:hypothetical protein
MGGDGALGISWQLLVPVQAGHDGALDGGIAAQVRGGNRSDARREAVYTLLEAVKEIDKAVLFAYGQKNAMAIAKLLESKGKLFGLYADRYQEVPVDLKGALAEARGRMLTFVTVTTRGHGFVTKVLTAAQSTVDDPAMSLSADGSIKWAPHIAGDKAQ